MTTHKSGLVPGFIFLKLHKFKNIQTDPSQEEGEVFLYVQS